MDWQSLKNKLEYLYEKFPVYLGVAMGFLLISLSTVNIYNLFTNEAYTFLNMTSWIFMLACGIFIIVIGWRNLVRTIGLYALSLGFTRLIMRYEQMDFSDLASTLILLIPFLLAANLMYTGSSFSLGRVIRRTSMMPSDVCIISRQR